MDTAFLGRVCSLGLPPTFSRGYIGLRWGLALLLLAGLQLTA